MGKSSFNRPTAIESTIKSRWFHIKHFGPFIHGFAFIFPRYQLTTLAGRCGEGSFYRPSPKESFLENMKSNSQMLRPFNQYFGFTIPRNNLVGSPISSLFFPGRPTAITWFVITIVVNALNGFFRGLVSHISKKVFNFVPSKTHGYTTTPIPVIGHIARIVTPFYHIFPCAIDRFCGQSTFTPCQTSTRARCARTKMLKGNRCKIPASAFTNPMRMFTDPTKIDFDSSKPSEYLIS